MKAIVHEVRNETKDDKGNGEKEQAVFENATTNQKSPSTLTTENYLCDMCHHTAENENEIKKHVESNHKKKKK